MARAIDGEVITAPQQSGPGFSLACLEEGSEIAEALRVNMATGSISESTLERITMPTGGSTTWSFSSQGNDVTTKEIVGVPCYFATRYTLWPSVSASGGKMPVLIATDSLLAHRVSDDIGDLDPEQLEAARVGDRTYSLERLSYAQWGSGKGGRGKRIRESRMICLLREGDAWPMLIQAGAMSCEALSKFFVTLSAPYYQCVIGLSLEKRTNGSGEPYAVIKPRTVGKLSREQGKVISETYTAMLRRMFQGIGASSAPAPGDDFPA